MEFDCFQDLPGIIETFGAKPDSLVRIEYVIWRNPWMVIGPGTFIGSMLAKVGVGVMIPPHEQPYPEINEADMRRRDTFYLFSSEPFPFARYLEELIGMGISGAVVDGEFYSWFGSRSYRMLKTYVETYLKTKTETSL